MPLPAGVTTALAHIDAPVSFGGTAGRVFLEVVPNMRLVHIATGTPIADFIDVRHPANGFPAEVTVPHTDQSGFQDDAGVPVTNWSYKATIRYELDGQLVQVPDKNFGVLVGQTSVDLALIPSGESSEPVFGNVPYVSSVNSRTGAVILTSADVGLGNVSNTSDASKPISTATQTALDAKAPINNPTFTGTVGGVTKTHVGLGNVDNTSDANKPISTATQTALNAKANTASPTFTGTVSGITKSMVGLGNVDNTADTAKPVSTAQQTALDAKAPINNPTFTGTVSGVTKDHVGLGNVDNTSDADKPISSATQTALDAKDNEAKTITTVTTSTSMAAGDEIIFVNSTTARTITLPNPATVPIGKRYVVKNINTATATVNSAGTSKTLDGASSQSLAQWAKASYVSNGSQWYTI